jgi:HEAT repeat protein
MARGFVGTHRGTVALLAALALSTLSGCPKDPYDPNTWIDKLDDPNEWERAATELEKLKDPSAIEPLGKAWEKYNHDSRLLRIIIALADPPADKGGPQWGAAVPTLKKAVDQVDLSKRSSVEDATIAADALGRSKDASAVDTLVKTANINVTRLNIGQNLRVAAVRALGNFNQPQAVDALIKILAIDPDKQPEVVNAAAANALAESGSEKALQPLLIALYAVPRIFPQVRNAITKLGPSAVPELIKILQGKHAEVNEYAKKNKFATDCDKGTGPDSSCRAPGNLNFKAAILLGDLRASEAVPVLMSVLKQPSKVSFFDTRTGAPGPADHNSVLDALRKIGDRSAADAVKAYLADQKTDDAIRPMAIDVYSFLARDGANLDFLSKEMKNDQQEDEEIRKSSAMAYSRLIYNTSQLEPIDYMIDRYQKEANKYDEKAAKANNDSQKAEAENSAQGYRNLVNTFAQYKVRALVGIKCKKDPACYGQILDMKSNQVIDLLRLPEKDKKRLERSDRDAYRTAALERALLEIMKLGKKAGSLLDQLLKHAESTERIVRQGVLMAMVQVAPPPCEKCQKRLDEVISAQEGRETLSELNVETRIVLHYYESRGGKAGKR